jgi:glutamate racemase
VSEGRLKIGVFDSGFGGLTVLRELLPLLPEAEFLYLGDTARLPYGSKSRATIVRYALGSTRFLLDQGADFLVIACNTATALALTEIRASTTVPVLGVIETGANEARTSSKTRDILVIGTEATISSHAYAAACRAQGLRALEKACPLLVPLVEEGWIDHPVTAEVVRIYLTELLEHAQEEDLNPDTLVLGCTHYPLLRPMMETAVAPAIRVIDSAQATASQAAQMLGGRHRGGGLVRGDASSRCRFFATDSVVKFKRLGARFLGTPLNEVELVDLGG